MSLREWLIAIGALIILGIVIDGVRRMRRARKEALAISSGMGADEIDGSPVDDDYNPELPNGGARPVRRDGEDATGDGESAPGRPLFRFSNQPQKPTRPIVDRFTATADGTDDEPASGLSAIPDDGELAAGEADSFSARGDAAAPDELAPAEPGGTEPEPEAGEDPESVETAPERGAGPEQTDGVDPDRPVAGANRPNAEQVTVINVLSDTDRPFEGAALKRLFEACGLEYGDLGIYHRHEESDTRSPVQFSVASAVEPGTFRPEEMPTLQTPGISFFMSLPGPADSLQAFEFMLETAQAVVRNLGGELKDERRSVMTPQTIEHCRQQIREYERRKRFRQHAN
ncbi:cell division protein ZipA [Tamilnaduibacter salinus]|uniref:Cell division protein ZipA n=1 Tax=Tamilnaduibacter salinus TaxID=1484056 RepID=A0A2A2I3S1_9GAMM|nr:cell division protein ZipA [Tamilnaduibacter salinus]PAV26297.1 cell division protein ZipA [Tamilnaduibacter salinus]PVY78042.1 cell division protein ZipA [Tamilnaduibacter salinus]